MTNKEMAEKVAGQLLECAQFMDDSMKNAVDAISKTGVSDLRSDDVTSKMRKYAESLYNLSDKQLDMEELTVKMWHWREEYMNVIENLLAALRFGICADSHVGDMAEGKMMNLVHEFYSETCPVDLRDKITDDWVCKKVTPEEFIEKHRPCLRTDII